MISVIIPTYNEAANIGTLVQHLLKACSNSCDVIVVDGGSQDNTLAIAAAAGATTLLSPQKGRAAQMNYGASLANGDILYFVHADTLPPQTFVADITRAVAEGYSVGRYRTRFMSSKPILRINEWFTHLDLFICMGGDQTLFVKKDLFARLGGFNPAMLIMEEYEFCKRARENAKYKIMKRAALISARKYDKNSWLQVQRANYKIVRMYKQGAPQEAMVQQYKKMLKF